jgi:hypothetical protein
MIIFLLKGRFYGWLSGDLFLFWRIKRRMPVSYPHGALTGLLTWNICTGGGMSDGQTLPATYPVLWTLGFCVAPRVYFQPPTGRVGWVGGGDALMSAGAIDLNVSFQEVRSILSELLTWYELHCREFRAYHFVFCFQKPHFHLMRMENGEWIFESYLTSWIDNHIIILHSQFSILNSHEGRVIHWLLG